MAVARPMPWLAPVIKAMVCFGGDIWRRNKGLEMDGLVKMMDVDTE